jgi:hypothetical protein
LHQRVFQKYLLAGFDILTVEDDLAGGVDHAYRNRGGAYR